MQLTNIIRDVGEDARRGRIYLPEDEMKHFGVPPGDLLKSGPPWGYGDRFEALMRFQARRAHAVFDEALALLPAADRKRQLPGLMMANIYRTLLRDIEAGGFRVLDTRRTLPYLRKVWIAALTRARGR
jgi:phytoene synthase